MPDKKVLIVAETLAKRLDAAQTVIVDCRFDLGDPVAGRRAYLAGHIPGSVYLDLDRDLAGPVTADTGRHPLPDIDQCSKRLGEIGIGNGSEVIVYDDANGSVAARAWWILRWLGHDAVKLLDGGLARWTRLGLPLEAGPVSKRPASFRAAPRPELVVTTDEIASARDAVAGMNLLDARDTARFRGEHEPIDPVAGHIPGAKSVPFAGFVHPDGTWRSPEQRVQRLLEALDHDRDAPWCVMCGSGVTACHLAISGVEGGLREPRVYVGSWSEWIRDAGRPIALGEG